MVKDQIKRMGVTRSLLHRVVLQIQELQEMEDLSRRLYIQSSWAIQQITR